MNIRYFILIASLFAYTGTYSQSDTLFNLERNYTGSISDFTVDNLGNIYLIYQNGQLKKLLPNGDSAAVFNDIRKYGKVYSIDVTNPLKVLLYYKDFQTILTLDRFLNVLSTLDLRKQNYHQVKAVGLSYDNNFWIFDEIDGKLKRIDDNGRLIDQSNDFRTMFDSMPSPDILVDQDKSVYLYDPAKGVYIFDYYGTFRSRIPFTGWADFKVINHALVGRDGRFLYRYNIGSLQLQQYPLPGFMNKASRVLIAPGLLYVLKDNEVKIYSYK